MIIQHLLLFVCLCFIIGRKPKSNHRKRMRAYEAAYRKPAQKAQSSDTVALYQPRGVIKLGVH